MTTLEKMNMTYKMNIKKALVVLSPDLIRADKPKQSPLIQRAVELAKTTGCELELFHVCYDGGLEHQLFESNADLERQRKKLTDQDATMLAEMATHLKSECINVRHQVRWDSPRTDAILRKIASAKPDVVMKQSRDHSFVLGITSNTDWDLARRSTAHLWFVSDNISDINRVVTAVGNKFGDPGDITTAEDYDLLRNARMINAAFNAEIYAVNAYQVPDSHHFGAGVIGAVAPVVVSADEQQKNRTQLVKHHGGSVKALAQYFNIDKGNVHVREGHPNNVIPDFAKSVDADMIIMGARNLNRFERLISSVTVEPVMADTKCDILIVGERNLDPVPNVVKNPVYGVPQYDLEHAITNPEATFDSPLAVANLPAISIELRNRILQAWEYDIRAEMTEENEGGPTGDIDINALDEIFSARAMLETRQEKSGNGHMALHGMTG